MDTSMFDPSFMKAAEQNMFPIATTRYIDERIAPHEMPSNNNYMPIDPVLLQQSMEGGYSTHQQFAVPPSVPTFQSDMPQHMYMPTQNGMETQEQFNDFWKSFTVGKSFSVDTMASHHHSQNDRNAPSGWYDASTSTSPEYPPNMMGSSTSNADYESYDMYSNDVQPMM